MGRVRWMVGLATVVCAFCAFAAPALAKKKEKTPPVFGKFIASFPNGKPISPATPATAQGHGELSNLILANGALQIQECEDVKSTGQVESERSETLLQNVTFKCYARVSLTKGITEELKLPKFTLGMEFHSNKSAEIGAASEVTIVKGSSVTIPVGKKAPCKVTIPEQTVPTQAEANPDREYEAAIPETEKDEAVNMKKFPAGFQEKLDIEMEFTKVEAWVKPNEHCIYSAGEEGSYDSTPETPAYGYVVYKKGKFDAELEEITIKNGNLGFEPKAEGGEEG